MISNMKVQSTTEMPPKKLFASYHIICPGKATYQTHQSKRLPVPGFWYNSSKPQYYRFSWLLLYCTPKILTLSTDQTNVCNVLSLYNVTYPHWWRAGIFCCWQDIQHTWNAIIWKLFIPAGNKGNCQYCCQSGLHIITASC